MKTIKVAHSNSSDMSTDKEAEEIRKFERELFERFGMTSNAALRKLFFVVFLLSAAVLIWLLTATELLLKLTFNDSQESTAWYLGIQSVTTSFFKFFFYNVYGAISDRIGRKPFILLTCFGGGVVAMMWGLFEGRMLLIWAIVAAILSIATSSFPIISIGYLKDCVAHHNFNKIRVHNRGGGSEKSAAASSSDENTYTAVSQQKWLLLWGGAGLGFGLLCQQGILLAFKNEDDKVGLKWCMLASGILQIFSGVYALMCMPETVDPAYCRASSLYQYFAEGKWREDCSPFKNLREVLAQGPALRCYALWFVLEQSGQSMHTLMLAQYLIYRFGMGSSYLGVLGCIAFICGIGSIVCAESIIETFGQLAVSWVPPILGDGVGIGLGLFGSLLYSGNNRGLILLLYAPAMFFTIPGLLVAGSFQTRLARYDMQAMTRGALSGLGQLVDFFLRFPALLIFINAMDTSSVPDLTRDIDCDDDDYVFNRTDVWLEANCPDMPPLTEAQGDAFDPIAMNFMVSGAFHAAALICWIVLIKKYNPLAEAGSVNAKAVQEWRERGEVSDDLEVRSAKASSGRSVEMSKVP